MSGQSIYKLDKHLMASKTWKITRSPYKYNPRHFKFDPAIDKAIYEQAVLENRSLNNMIETLVIRGLNSKA